MWRKIILLVLLLLSVNITLVEAGATDEETILLLYTPRSSMENVKKLDLILHHFSAETKVLDTEMIREDILHEADYIVFYNESEESLPENILEKLHGKKKALIFIGDKVTELWPTMSTEEAVINSVSFTKEGKRFPLEEKVKMHIPNRSPEQEVLLYGFYGEAVMPLLVRNNAGYYLGVTELNDLILQHVAEVLHDIIDNDHPAIHEAYLRLENIHPLTDPKKVEEVVSLLESRNIPFAMAVQPVYTNPDTGDVTTLQEADELLKVIQEAQSSKATLLVQGYTNDQKAGYEFWDINFDQPMMEQVDKEAMLKRKPQAAFQTREEYEAYRDDLSEKEQAYVQTRLEKAIKALVKEELYPIAFTPPYGLMGEAGYEAVATYFSSMLGPVQLSDENSTALYAAPFKTRASFLQGMNLYPTTVGDISPISTADHEEMAKNLAKAQIVRDGMIGLSYQTYLGAGQLSKQLDKVEQISSLQWLDLSQTEQTVSTGVISVQSSADQAIHFVNHLTWKDRFTDWINQFSILEKMLWVVTLFVFVFVVLFLFFALYLRLQLKKRLFEERK